MSTNAEPLVSVITSVNNGADFLAECLESVLKQTYPNFECIMVNSLALLKQPRATVGKTIAGMRRKGKVEARYY
jgi:cellulose synthase/poly-beta-1,6-N-acetylglucosamine synthase-like glycosyltransferase